MTPVRVQERVSRHGILLAAEEKKIERLLQDAPKTPAEVAGEAGVPEGQVFAFFNAALAVGAARVEQAG